MLRSRSIWTQKYMKTNFQRVFFNMSAMQTWKSQWTECWGFVDGHHVPTRLQCQQGGGGLMFWARIKGKELVGHFRVPRGVKMTSVKHLECLTDHFLPWYTKNNRAFQSKIIFMSDNAPSHAAKNTSASLAAMGIKPKQPSSKRSIRVGGSLHPNGSCGRLLWHPAKKFKQKTLQKFTRSMDVWNLRLLANNGSYVKM